MPKPMPGNRTQRLARDVLRARQRRQGTRLPDAYTGGPVYGVTPPGPKAGTRLPGSIRGPVYGVTPPGTRRKGSGGSRLGGGLGSITGGPVYSGYKR